jgi:hypothetical protein
MAFSQYMLIWVANLPEEIPYILVRTRGAWKPVFVALCLGHFIVPFFILLSRDLKRRPELLAIVAGWMLLMHVVDLCWLVLPSSASHQAGAASGSSGLHWTLFTSFAGIGGLAIAFAVFRARGRYAVPVRDPFLPDSLEYVQP